MSDKQELLEASIGLATELGQMHGRLLLLASLFPEEMIDKIVDILWRCEEYTPGMEAMNVLRKVLYGDD